MAEDQKWHEACNHVLCANNCGFFGSPTTLNLCSKCYKDCCPKEQRNSKAKLAVEKSLIPPPLQPPESSSSSYVSVSVSPDRSVPKPSAAAVRRDEGNRCGSCRWRVGLTGFRCRCGTTFCGTHRYPEKHAWTFDYKAVGKEAIARENPVVTAAKLHKI